MKIFAFISSIIATKLYAVDTTNLTPSIGSDPDAICLTKDCDEAREYCDSSISKCRAITNDIECYNATTALFQDGCDVGHECIDDLCRVSTNPIDGRTCHIICSAGKFCENETTKCRAPSYDAECFNLETGLFQNGCEEGYYCSFHKCVDVSLED